MERSEDSRLAKISVEVGDSPEVKRELGLTLLTMAGGGLLLSSAYGSLAILPAVDGDYIGTALAGAASLLHLAVGIDSLRDLYHLAQTS